MCVCVRVCTVMFIFKVPAFRFVIIPSPPKKKIKKANILNKKFYPLIIVILIVNIQTIQMKTFQYSL